ncbi:MAG: hypothetical protein LBB07_00975 [Bifidobacteriaceae bacterium]|jgi:prepilin signal peptidase PulO-like enzyme (type II secretory pathway)|nr:hypothetical protein [Bifidobacteriaceae bacterium]
MTFQIVFTLLAFVLCLANAIIDLKSNYLYDILSILAFLAGVSLYIIYPSKITIYSAFSIIFVCVLFFILYKVKTLEAGDVKYIAGFSPALAFISPEVLYFGSALFCLTLSAIWIIKKIFGKNKSFPAGMIIFCSYLITALFAIYVY